MGHLVENRQSHRLVKADITYRSSMETNEDTQLRHVRNCPLPVIDISGPGMSLKNFIGGRMGPVVVYDGQCAVLVTEYPVALVAGIVAEGGSEVGSINESVIRNSNEFVSMGDYWALRFNGFDAGPIKDEKGMVYIHRLLSRPSYAFSYHELRGPVSGTQEQSSVEMSFYSHESENQIGRIARTPSTSVDDVDQKTRDNIERQFKYFYATRKSLHEKVNRLSEDADVDVKAIEEIENRIEKNEKDLGDLERYVRKNSFGGKKIMDANEKNLRNAIQTAIERCIQSLIVVDPEFGMHLKKCITRQNGTVEYRPPVGVSWMTVR